MGTAIVPPSEGCGEGDLDQGAPLPDTEREPKGVSIQHDGGVRVTADADGERGQN